MADDKASTELNMTVEEHNVTIVEDAPLILTVTETDPKETILTELVQGPPGVDGAKGEKGDKGDPGIDSFYLHIQDKPSKIWVITHSLQKYPSVTIVDSGNSAVLGDCRYVDSNSLELHFSAPFSGRAYLN